MTGSNLVVRPYTNLLSHEPPALVFTNALERFSQDRVEWFVSFTIVRAGIATDSKCSNIDLQM